MVVLDKRTIDRGWRKILACPPPPKELHTKARQNPVAPKRALMRILVGLAFFGVSFLSVSLSHATTPPSVPEPPSWSIQNQWLCYQTLLHPS